jgi:hypothetical protein
MLERALAARRQSTSISRRARFVMLRGRGIHGHIEFAVRARLGRDSWALTILPKNRGPVTLDFIGTRDEAIAAAHRSINSLDCE